MKRSKRRPSDINTGSYANTSKLQNILSGHKVNWKDAMMFERGVTAEQLEGMIEFYNINEDDAAWLRSYNHDVVSA